MKVAIIVLSEATTYWLDIQLLLRTVMYEFGRGTLRSFPLAARWYQKAAKNNFALAQDALAGLYLRGEGVRQDLAMAYFWYNLAAEQGHPSAVRHLKELQVQTPDTNILPQVKAREQLEACLRQTDMLCHLEPAPWDDHL